MAMWNEMGNSNTCPKAEGDVSAEATAKSPIDDTPEEAQAALHLAEKVETTDEARDESPRHDLKCKSQQTLAEEPQVRLAEADELALDSKGERGLMDGRNELADTITLPEIVEEPNRQEYEDGWKGKRTTPVCMNLEDAAVSPDTNTKSTASESDPAGEGMEKSSESLSNLTEAPLGGIGELVGPAEPKAGGLSASDELGSAEGKERAIASTLPSSANKDDAPEEMDTLVEEGISTIEDIREDDANLGEETDNTTAEMKSLEMAEPGDPVQNGGEHTESKENSLRNSLSGLDSDNATVDRDRSILLQLDDTRVEDESIVFVKPTGIPSTNHVREVGGHFECEAHQSPSEEVPASDLKDADAHIKIERDLECPVNEEGAFMAIKAPELGIAGEGFPTPREECFVGLTQDILTQAESKEVFGRISEAENPTEDTNSDIKRDARVSYEDIQAFDPLKLYPPALAPPPINEEASKVGSEGGGGLSREEKEVLDSRSQGSKPDKAINLRMKKSPSFDFDLRITRTEESDRTPLLFQDKRVVRTATAMTAEISGNTERKKLPIAKERVLLSFGPADSRTPSLGFSREEHESSGFHSCGIPEKKDHDKKQEKVQLLAPAKELKVVDSPSSPEQKGKRRPRSSLFGNCMCCATIIN